MYIHTVQTKHNATNTQIQQLIRQLKLRPQIVQPIVNPVHLCPDLQCVTSLSNVRSRFNNKMPISFKSSKEFTSVVRYGKDQNSGYPKL